MSSINEPFGRHRTHAGDNRSRQRRSINNLRAMLISVPCTYWCSYYDRREHIPPTLHGRDIAISGVCLHSQNQNQEQQQIRGREVGLWTHSWGGAAFFLTNFLHTIAPCRRLWAISSCACLPARFKWLPWAWWFTCNIAVSCKRCSIAIKCQIVLLVFFWAWPQPTFNRLIAHSARSSVNLFGYKT